MKFLLGISSFFKEVRLEMKKVNWLTRQEVFRHTILVIIFALAVAIYLGAFDFVIQWVLARI